MKGAQVFGTSSATWIVIDKLTGMTWYNHERDEEMKKAFVKVKDMILPESATLPDYLGNVGVISSDMSSTCNPGREVQTLNDIPTASHPLNPALQLRSDQGQAYNIITTHPRKMILGGNQEQSIAHVALG